jgi:putative tryptophan/tyrosine transport system substrate-binding protein
MKRRDVITLLGGAVAAWPLATRAQQLERMRRIGILLPNALDDPIMQIGVAAFMQGLQEFSWAIGRNVRIELRWSPADAKSIRRQAEELVALAPDVILAYGGAAVGPLQEASGTVPIVFVGVTDPVGAGYVESLSRPGTNATGFARFEFGFSGKWLELLKQIAPSVARVAIIRDPVRNGQFGALQGAAPAFAVDVTPVGVRDADEIERGISSFARGPNGGLIVTAGPFGGPHRELIVTLAARHRLPAVYPSRISVTLGGLISYGPDLNNHFRLAAGYVDRILKGEKPADLPVQAPTKYELVINLKTAKALGLIVPPSMLATADEVIE